MHEYHLLEARVVELEIRTALQDELLASLNDTVAQMRDVLELQQEQLRLLYRRMEQQGSGGFETGAAPEIPPHY